MLISRLAGWLAALLAVLVVIAIGAQWARRRQPRRPGDGGQDDRLDTVGGWPPTVTRLMTQSERSAFSLLRQALPDYIVFAQVPLARFIDVPKRNSYADWLRRVGYQSIDFLVCDGRSQVVAAVELQPAAAQATPRALKRQLRIARILKAAKVPLHVWTAESLPSAELARDSILGLPAEPLSSSPMPLGEPESGPGLPPLMSAPSSSMPSPAAASAGGAAPAAAAARGRNPFEESGRDSSQDEHIEAPEPPPTTWYDDFDSGPTPLAHDKRRRD